MLLPRHAVHGPGAICACLVLWAGPAAAGAEVDEFIGQRVVEVEFATDGILINDPAVRELVETTAGEPLAMREVRESLAHLFSLGRYGHVAVDAYPRAGGVALLYELRPFELVERIELSGNRVLADDDVRRVVVQRHGEVFPASAAAAVADTVRAYYAERGFLSPRVDAELRGSATERTLRLTIVAGARARVNRWFITGVASALLNTRLRARLGLVDGDVYDGARLDQRLSEYEGELRALQYYEARLSHTVERRTDADIDVRLNILRGPRITVTLSGDEVPDARLGDLVPVGREASVDEDLLEDADRRIAAHLRSLGYRDADVTHTADGTADELSIVFAVTRGPFYQVVAVRIRGNASVPTEVLLPVVNITSGDPLIVSDVDAGLAAIEERYQQLGYATVRATRTFADIATGGAAGTVMQTVDIDIVEGPRMTIAALVFDGVEAWPFDRLEETVAARIGEPFYGPQVSDDRDALLSLYLNDGYEQAVVVVEPQFADDLRTVDLVFRVDEGRQVLVDHVLIVGNRRVDSETIRGELALAPGDPLGLDDVAETRRRLNALGMFRGLDIREFSHGSVDRRDVIIEVEEAPATTLAYGGGLEVSQRLRRDSGDEGSAAVERIEFAPRGSFQIGRRNLWGKNRSINLFTRVSVRRKNDPSEPGSADAARTLGFNEYRVLGTYREPRSFRLRWDVLMSGYVEQAIRPGFDLFTRGVTAQVVAGSGDRTSTTLGYRLGSNDTSNRQLDPEDSNIVDRLFPEVRLSSFRLSRLRDTRNDPFDPTRGTVLTAETELAARSIGSAVGFTKTFLSGSFFRELRDASRLVFAASARVGLAWGFPQTYHLEGPGGPMEVSQTLDLPISERFFAGGDNTVRGFALDRLGDPREEPGGTIDQDGFPQGGNAVLIFNTELRVRLTRAVGLVTFLDAGNVYDDVQHVSLRRIRGGAGFGVRYSSPVGPIRVDLGFKLGERHFFGDETSRTQEPLTALHISIGQAF